MSKRMLLVAGLLSSAALLAAESTARAQISVGRGWNGQWGVTIGNPGWSGGNYYGGSPGWYGGNYYNPGYSGVRYSSSPYWNYNYASPRYGWSTTPYYSSGYNWNYASPRYGSTFTTSPLPYASTNNSYVQAPYSGTSTSFYYSPSPSASSGLAVPADRVNLWVNLPNPNAQLWIEGEATQQQGSQRLFVSPPLEPGNYKYTVKASWNENGQTVTREKQVRVQPGQEALVAFHRGTDESDLNRQDVDPNRDLDPNRPAVDPNRATDPNRPAIDPNRNLDPNRPAIDPNRNLDRSTDRDLNRGTERDPNRPNETDLKRPTTPDPIRPSIAPGNPDRPNSDQ